EYTLQADGQKMSSLEYNYDASQTTPAQTLITWTYDNQNRLLSETYDVGNNGPGAGDYKDTYTYDPVGNRQTWYHDDGNNGLTSAADQTTSYSYLITDATGRTIVSGNDWLTSESMASGDYSKT